MSAWEIAGSALGVLGVVLMIRQHLAAWPVGLVQVAIYAWVFFEARLYAGALLQAVFFGLLVYGWWHWWRAGRDSGPGARLPVTRLNPRGRLILSVASAALALAWGEALRRFTDAAQPHGDAAIFAFSLLAQGLQARKKLENWVVWIGVNLLAVGVYAAQGLYLTSGLYAVFLALAVAGLRSWRRSEREAR
jgi:nicotinamide mononucleotide transporter